MATTSVYAYKKIKAPDKISLEALKTFTRSINDNVEDLSTKVYNNIEYANLSTKTQKVIEEKVDTKTMLEELANKANLGDLDAMGDNPPTSPTKGKVWLCTSIVPNEWLKWKGIVAQSTARNYKVSLIGTSVGFPDVSDSRTLNVVVKTVATQAGSGTPSPSNVRAISPAVAAGANMHVYRHALNWFNPADYASLASVNNVYKEIPLVPNKSYRVTITRLDGWDGTGYGDVMIRPTNPSTGGNYSAVAHNTYPNNRLQYTYTTGSDGKFWVLVTGVATQAGLDYIWSHVQVQIELGTVSTTYEAYTGSNDEYSLIASKALYGLTGYEDEIGNDGHETHKTVFYQFSGSETFNILATYTNCIRFSTMPQISPSLNAANVICSHAPYNVSGTDAASVSLHPSTHAIMLTLPKTIAPDVATLKTWLANQVTAGTPVQVVYELAAATTSTGTATPITGIDGDNIITSDGVSLTVTYTGSGWTNVGGTAELAALVSQIGAMTLNNGDFRGLLQSISKLSTGLLLTGLGGTLSLLLGPNRIGFWDGGTEVAYITDNKLYINSGEFVAELKIGNYFLVPDSSGGLVIK